MFCYLSAFSGFQGKQKCCYFCEPKTSNKKMQTACLQYPNFYGFVLWNLDVLNCINIIFFYNKWNKTYPDFLFRSFSCANGQPSIFNKMVGKCIQHKLPRLEAKNFLKADFLGTSFPLPLQISIVLFLRVCWAPGTKLQGPWWAAVGGD